MAKAVSTSNAKLKVRFFGVLSGDYWVLDQANDEGWSIVGEPSGRDLWIFAGKSNPGPDKVGRLIERTAEMGYDGQTPNKAVSSLDRT